MQATVGSRYAVRMPCAGTATSEISPLHVSRRGNVPKSTVKDPPVETRIVRTLLDSPARSTTRTMSPGRNLVPFTCTGARSVKRMVGVRSVRALAVVAAARQRTAANAVPRTSLMPEVCPMWAAENPVQGGDQYATTPTPLSAACFCSAAR